MLGFATSDFNRPTKEFSGGWRMRIELAKLLLQRPDVLLLDEPTNHLDIESIRWLESFLARCGSAVVLVSHDRAFIKIVHAADDLETLVFVGEPFNQFHVAFAFVVRTVEQFFV